MDLFFIRRRNGWKSPAELEAAAAKSKKIGNDEMSDRVRWIRSYVVKEPSGALGTVCYMRRRTPNPFASMPSAWECRPTRSFPSATPWLCGKIRLRLRTRGLKS